MSWRWPQTATGHHLDAALSPHGPDEHPQVFEDILFVVDTSLRNARRVKTAENRTMEVRDDRQSATVTVNCSIDGRVAPKAFDVALIDGRFPDWRHFVRETARRLVQVDPQADAGETVAPFSTAAAALWQRLSVADGKRANVRLHASAMDGHRMDPDGIVSRGMVIRVIGDDNFFAVLMPVAVIGGTGSRVTPCQAGSALPARHTDSLATVGAPAHGGSRCPPRSPALAVLPDSVHWLQGRRISHRHPGDTHENIHSAVQLLALLPQHSLGEGRVP